MNDSKSIDNRPAFPIRKADLHTRAMGSIVYTQATQWTPVGPEAVGVPSEVGGVPTVDVIPSVLSVPTEDEDTVPQEFGKQLTAAALQRLPIADDPKSWDSVEAAKAFVAEAFTPILPAPKVVWSDPTSDRAIELLALQGLASHRLEPTQDGPTGAAFMVDLSWMGHMPVRPNYQPYGACAYFSESAEILEIYTSHDDTFHTPQDRGWAHAKWTWRCSLFAAVTLEDHLGSVHYLMSNAVVTVARKTLSPTHPLRRLLKAFTYGTVDINRDAAMSLSNRGGAAHRLFAFTYEGVVKCVARGVQAGRFQTFPERVAAQQVESLGDRFLFAKDGLALHEIFTAYTREYLDLYFTPQAMVADAEIRKFWIALSEVAPSLGLAPLVHSRQLERLVAEFMFGATGMHAQVGGVVEYVIDPEFIGAKIRPGSCLADPQSTAQLLNLTVLTQMEQPPLIGDYAHLLLDEEAVAVFRSYQASLGAFSQTIASRNETLEQPYQTFNPVFLDTSVST